MLQLPQTELSAISHVLTERHQSIAIAESVTGGLLQYALASIPQASEFFQGGITAFNVAQKYKHLQVEPIHALSVNAVSANVAEQMALNVCRLFTSNWGLAVTGYSTPVPQSNQQLYAFYAIAFEGKVVQADKLTPHATHPAEVQEEYVKRLVAEFVKKLGG